MDRDNKYYSLIENLVRNNRKFPGYEAIVDDIIDDVFAHSEFVINSIDDENVIAGYLEKVIATSIITVPKKLNFQNELKHRSANKVESIALNFKTEPNNSYSNEVENINNTPELIQTEQTVTEQVDFVQQESFAAEKANPELVDKMINTIDADSIVEIDSKEKTKIENDSQEFELNYNDNADDIIVEENSTDQLDFQQESLEEELAENLEDIEPIQEEIENIEPQQEDTVSFGQDEINLDAEQDDSFELSSTEDFENIEPQQEDIETFGQDKLNLDTEQEDSFELSSTEEIENIEPQQEDTVSFGQDEINLDAEQEDSFELSSTEEIENIEPHQEDIETFGQDELNLDAEQEDSFELNSTEDIENIELQQEDIESFGQDELNLDAEQEDSFDINLTDEVNSIDYAQDNIEPLNIQQDDEDFNFTENSFDLTNTDESEQIEIMDIDENTSSADISQSIELPAEETDNDVQSVNCKKIDYSIFNYTPSSDAKDIDKKYIIDNLVKIDKDNPNLHIIDIFELRYKQNETIDNIVQQLNISKQDVLTALNKMADLV